ncbi:MAG TPA: SDR family NAD(P)-dependent oxidoreductase [Myxococcaceae bacterium]|nr:SDR family NAD(P)-dependent oxidoreductase [Myxococcaceae bacterium]
MGSKRLTAVVTGATRGIGRAIALKFAENEYVVWALGRNIGDLERVKAEASRRGGDVRTLRVDVAERDEVIAACDALLSEVGAPAVLVNNAGIALSSPLTKTRPEDFDRVMAINAAAPFFFCRELIPAMAASTGGRVINIASTAALKGFKYTAAYCASKHALLGLTRALAIEFARKNVTVNAICPGWTETDMLSQSAKAISSATGRTVEEARKILTEMNPMSRLIQPADVADLCLFLASPGAAAITGAAYPIDGGEAA